MLKLYMMDIRKLIDNQEFIDKILANASDTRLKKYKAYRNDVAKRQSIAATYILDEALKEFGLREKDMKYGVSKRMNGKPTFANHPELHFNISHSKNVSMVAICDKKVGVDVQSVEEASNELYRLVLNEEEKKVMEQIKDEGERNYQFFKYWVMKETLVKYDGQGLNESMIQLHNDDVFMDEFELEDIHEKYLYGVYCEDIKNILGGENYGNIKSLLVRF